MTGIQALVRLPIQQRRRDAAAGHEHRRLHLRLPGLAAGALRRRAAAAPASCWRSTTSSSGRASTRISPPPRSGARSTSACSPARRSTACSASGTARGPGVDRSGDALRHANWAGTSPLGGVLALAGDDHGAKSSTVANYSDHPFDRGRHAGAVPVQRAGAPRLRPARHRDEPLLGLLGRHEAGRPTSSRAAARSRWRPTRPRDRACRGLPMPRRTGCAIRAGRRWR